MNSEKLNKSKERKEIPESIELDGLISILIDAKIPLDSWGVEDTKTIDNLLNEVKNGESKLALDETGKIERYVDIALVDVIHISKESVVYGLISEEEKQAMENGEEFNSKLPTLLAKKIRPDESTESASYRALQEELGIDKSQIDSLHEFKNRVDIAESKSYPGLTTHYNTQPYMAIVSAESFDPNGYEKDNDGKINRSFWSFVNS